MSGTLITYQGIPCESVIYRRSTGLRPDASTVVLSRALLPKVIAPAVGEGPANPGGVKATPAPIQQDVRGIPPGLEHLRHKGELLMAENVDDDEWVERVPGLYFASGSLDADSDLVVVTMVDRRAFGGLGEIDRWLINVPNANGEVQEDTSQDPKGRPWTAKTLAEYLFSRMWGEPELVTVPSGWESLPVSFTFKRRQLATAALAELLDRHPARVALHSDDTFGLYRKGVGEVGDQRFDKGATIPEGAPRQPALQIDEGYLLHGGDVTGVSLGYPPDYVIVSGGERIATVFVDCWEPVLLIDGVPVPLAQGFAELLGAGDTEALLEELRQVNGRISDAQSSPPPTAAQIDDALDRLPALGGEAGRSLQAELDALASQGRNDEQRRLIARRRLEAAGEPVGGQPNPADLALRDRLEEEARKLRSQDPPEASEEDMAWLRRFVLRPDVYQARPDLTSKGIEILKRDAYRLWRLPGAETFYAHLLPMRNRAETGGKDIRLKPVVWTYRWKFRSVALSGTLEGSDLTTRGRALSSARRELAQAEHDLAQINEQITEAFSFTTGFSFSDLGEIFDEGGSYGAGLKEVAKLLETQEGLFEGIGGNARTKAYVNEAGRRGIANEFPALQAEAIGRDGLAAAYRRALDARNAAGTALREGGQAPNFRADNDTKFFRKVLEIGKEFLDNPEDISEAAVRPAADILREGIRRQREAAEKRAQEEGGDSPETGTDRPKTAERGKELEVPKAVHAVNMPLQEDQHARVVDADLGLIRTQLPAGWLDEEDVAVLDGRTLVPKPVGVSFGTALAPPRDERPPERYPWCADAPQDRFPPQFVDVQERGYETGEGRSQGALEGLGYFERAYRRQPGDEPTQVKVEEVPAGQAKPLHRPDLIELIRITGDDNVGDIEAKAEAQAATAFGETPEQQSEARLLVLRPRATSPNGRVAGVEIRLDVTRGPDQQGFVTMIVVGEDAAPFEDANKTRTRKQADAGAANQRAQNQKSVTSRA